jgi:benzoyl-CoA-dihydrodiol lyase
VNFCKFTNETRLSIEDASESSGQIYMAAIAGSAAGGGYELAVTADHIMLIDDRRSSVSLPELPLLAVLPGTGGLTRLTDKRRVRRDRADIFCTAEEGVRGKRAVDWRLVDEVVPPSMWEAKVAERALELAARSDRDGIRGVTLTPLQRSVMDDVITYQYVDATIDRPGRSVTVRIQGPSDLPGDLRGLHDSGAGFWPLAMARELDDLLLHLRLNEPSIGLIVFRSVGDPAQVLAADSLLEQYQTDWLVREIRLLLKRVFKRVDMMARSLITLVDPGSCFAGFLAELVFAADRAVMFAGAKTGDNQGPATLHLSALNFSGLPMGNGLSRLASRFYGEPDSLNAAAGMIGEALDADTAEAHGLVTFAYDDIDWDDEVRLILEERASFSPDALTGLEANLRFVGPETMETRIFGRLTAWQNWIFQRPNAVGDAGSLKRYGSGVRPDFNTERV